MRSLFDRYIFTELLPPFFVSLGALCFVMLTKEMLRLVELLVSHGVGLTAVLKVILYLMPSFLVLALPIAGIIASITAFSRLSADREIIAMRASGLSILRLSRPVFVFACLVFGLTLALSQWGQPWSNVNLKELALKVLSDQLTLALEKGVFNEPIPKMVVYVDEGEPDVQMNRGIFISDERDAEKPMLILAEQYLVMNDPDRNRVVLQLMNGSVHTRSKDITQYQQSFFAIYRLPVPIDPKLYGPARERPTRESILARLDETDWQDNDARRRLVESYKDLAFPMAALLLCMVGVPIGIFYKRSGRLGGFAVGVVVIILYYVLNVFFDFLVVKHVLWPGAGAWLPNLIVLVAGVVLYQQVGKR